MKFTKKRIGIIGTVGVPSRYGGFETLAHQLILQLRDRFDFTTYCSARNYKPEERVARWKGSRLVYLPFQANGVQSIVYDIVSMIHALIFCDVLLVLGVSGGIFLPLVKLFSRKKVIVNIDGLEWRRIKWSGPARRFLRYSEKLAVRYADEVITDNAAIQQYVAEFYGRQSRLIEYGADHVDKVLIDPGLVEKYPFLNSRYAFKVCRIEPENNIHLVLEAFARFRYMPLVIVGNWKNSAYGRDLRELYSQYPFIHLVDPVYDPHELNMLRSNCQVYVHGHSAGGTNPSLVEAMHLGLPVIAYGAVYNRITTEHQCLYFDTADDLLGHLENLPALSLRAQALRMKEVADRRYSWQVIANKYRWCLEDRQPEPEPKPEIISEPAALQQAF